MPQRPPQQEASVPGGPGVQRLPTAGRPSPPHHAHIPGAPRAATSSLGAAAHLLQPQLGSAQGDGLLHPPSARRRLRRAGAKKEARRQEGRHREAGFSANFTPWAPGMKASPLQPTPTAVWWLPPGKDVLPPWPHRHLPSSVNEGTIPLSSPCPSQCTAPHFRDSLPFKL